MHSDSDSHDDKKPCRTCTDFKTWAKQQKSTYTVHKKPEVSCKIRNDGIEIIQLWFIFEG